MRRRNSNESESLAGSVPLPCGDGDDPDQNPCTSVERALTPPCQRVVYRVRFSPGRAAVALMVALAGLLALSGRSVPLADRLFRLAAGGGDGRQEGGILSNDLLRQLTEVKFNDREETSDGGTLHPDGGKTTKEKKKKVAFLFLIRDSVAHQDLWTKWFESSTQGDWKDRANVYVHIKPSDEERPRTTIPDLAPLFCDRVIPSVRTKWFFLHHAMMQLMLYSYIQRDNTHFVFVSDSSVPLKSFDRVYDELVNKDDRSRVCHADPGEGRGAWKPFSTDPRVRGAVGVLDMSKASLWSSYSRHHVRYLLENAETLAEWYGGYMDAVSHRWGAADEMLLPTLLRTHVSEEELSDCHGTIGVGGPMPLESSAQSRSLAEEQESKADEIPPSPSKDKAVVESRRLCCTHAEKWVDTNTRDMNVIPREGLSPLFDASQCSGGPCVYTKLSHAELKELTQMEGVLFLRKVAKEAIIFTEDQKWAPLEGVLGGLLGIENGPKEGGEEVQIAPPKARHFCAVDH